MRISNRILLSGLTLLSLQGAVHYQAALASPDHPAPSSRSKRLEHSVMQLAAEPSPSPTPSPSPEPENRVVVSSSDDEGILCCIGDILAIAGVLAFGMLCASLVLWLIKEAEKNGPKDTIGTPWGPI